jgi:hypothetical protein
VLVPTRGALGRWQWEIDTDIETVRAAVFCEHVYVLVVERPSVNALYESLAERFEKHIDTLQEQPRYQLEFVYDDASYWAPHNCNHVTAAWLRELGCEVRGSVMFAEFEVKGAKDGGT